MATYTIRDLEKLSGIKAHTIRIWEKRYGLIEPQRSSTNIREYCDNDLKRLLNVSMLHKHGFKISKIAKLSQKEIAEKISHLLQYSGDTDSQVESLSIAMLDLDEEKFEKILSRIIIQMGFEDAVMKVLYPFFRRIGVMWQTGTVNPAQEHFVSNLVRQKLIVALDSQLNDLNANAKKFLLFLPENEMHEIGLLFFAYLLKRRGHKIIYLGQSLPVESIVEILQMRPVDYLITSIVTTMYTADVNEYVKDMAKTFADKIILVSGEQIRYLDTRDIPSNVKLIASPVEFIHEIDLLTKSHALS